ncbi:MAG: NAD+ synthase (glutamine-hydrolysing) [Chloroflexi bacterium]|nr:MAG: NAD+ synthase (glutamine-hydrolysing) [Chloroflexota bacterium]
MRSLRVALAQINPAVGDLSGNTQRILDAITASEAAACDLVVLPELALTGYPPEDLILRRTFVHENLAALDRIQAATAGRHVTAVVGFVDLAPDAYNAAAILHDGHRAGVYHKQYLPNYGVFDESRYFRAGREAPVFQIAGVPVGVSICEDIWYSSGPVQAQALAGAEVVVNLNGSPFHAGKIDQREKMLATRAADNAVIVCYVNMVGGQDSLIFDGGSMIHDPRGERVAAAPMFEEALLIADLDVEAVGQVRLHDPRLRRLAPEKPEYIPVSSPPPNARPPIDPTPNRDHPDDAAAIYQALVLGTRDYVRKTGFQKVVIALSGGIDSTLTATIAVDALGADNVTCVAMPSRYSSEGSVGDAHALAENLGIELLTIPIEGPFAANLAALDQAFAGHEPDVAEENLQARIRGTLIMALSNKFGSLVLTTSNKSESATGYTTLYGDMTGGLAVIQDVPKTTVYRLARHVNDVAGSARIPEAVIDKPPSAELRPDQRDEDSLMPYDRLDPILQAFVEEDRTLDEIVAQGFDRADVERVMTLVTRAEYKRRQAAPGLKITPRAFGKDRRFPIANAYRGF